jgi:hypothetical protein
MTSQVNPNNIDGTFPIAGQDNDSQGFRDNFTNTKNNFQAIYNEITDLQSKAVLKSALTNTTLNNDLSGAEITNATLMSYGEAYYNAGALSGAQSIDFTNGNYQRVQLGGAVTLSFTNWPASGIAGKMILQVRIETAGVSGNYTVTFPATTTLGFPSQLAGSTGLVVAYPQAGDYFYEIISTDNGASFFVRELSRAPNNVQGNLTVTGTISGNINHSGTQIDSGYQYSAAANHFNATVNNNVKRYIMDPAGTLSNGTLTLPSANVDATVVTVSSTQIITNFQVKPNTGITLVPSANVTMAAGGSATFFFHASESKWYKIG